MPWRGFHSQNSCSSVPLRTPRLPRGAAHRRWMASSQYIIKQHVICRVIWLCTVAERGVGRRLQRCTPPRHCFPLKHVNLPFVLLLAPEREVNLDGMGGEGHAQAHQVPHNVGDDDQRATQGRVVLTRRVQPLQNPRVAMYLQQEGEGANTQINSRWDPGGSMPDQCPQPLRRVGPPTSPHPAPPASSSYPSPPCVRRKPAAEWQGLKRTK